MTGKDITRKGRPYDYGADYHLPTEETHIASFSVSNFGQDAYEKYPIFGDRLRELVAYMDSQKPGGLRGLWYDKRDSGAWYTFWAVSIKYDQLFGPYANFGIDLGIVAWGFQPYRCRLVSGDFWSTGFCSNESVESTWSLWKRVYDS